MKLRVAFEYFMLGIYQKDAKTSILHCLSVIYMK